MVGAATPQPNRNPAPAAPPSRQPETAMDLVRSCGLCRSQHDAATCQRVVMLVGDDVVVRRSARSRDGDLPLTAMLTATEPETVP
jgi:hypothetical protein